MKYISRFIESKLKSRFFKGKVIIIYGARQVGKTTLAKKILAEYGTGGRFLNCELHSVVTALSELEAEKIRAFLGEGQVFVLDEAQNVPNIGKLLKIMIDTYPEIQLIATGSASFDLMQKISEPLTGRNFTFILYPLALAELKEAEGLATVEAKLENLLRFGGYPEISWLSEREAIERLNEIASDYLFKDAIKFDGLKKAEIIRNLLRLLALQLGQEVSYTELGAQLGIDRLTVQKYLDILEQCFIVFRLRAFSRNKRKEVSKSIKVYFYDLGIRNSLIENFNRLELRTDVGALWENLMIIERMKNNSRKDIFANSYFWRTYTQKEIDLIEDYNGQLHAYEFKWGESKRFSAASFVKEYPGAEAILVNRKNYWKFIS